MCHCYLLPSSDRRKVLGFLCLESRGNQGMCSRTAVLAAIPKVFQDDTATMQRQLLYRAPVQEESKRRPAVSIEEEIEKMDSRMGICDGDIGLNFSLMQQIMNRYMAKFSRLSLLRRLPPTDHKITDKTPPWCDRKCSIQPGVSQNLPCNSFCHLL